MAKYKYYVVWEGRARGIFDSWEECKEQVDNFKGAKYKSFDCLLPSYPLRLSPTVYRSMRLVAETPEKWNTGE